jgi:hypothetical protein
VQIRTRLAGVALGAIFVPCFSSLATVATAGPYIDAGHPIAAMATWATAVEELVRGPMDLAVPSGGLASWGTDANVIGPASGDALDVVSLGDGGSITLGFESGIGDGPGDDFAVFENGFWTEFGLYAELAFVEVSSNGVDFARFDAVALPSAPVVGDSEIDPTDYTNFAGLHMAGLGTGFDLAELADHPLALIGVLDLADVAWVRLVDVVGDGSRVDANAAPVYDPYPTAWWTGGFDLDGVGVIHVSAVPEPGFLASLAAGLLGLAALARRHERRGAAIVVALCCAGAPAAAVTVDFEDLGLGPESHYDGADLAGGFTSSGVWLENGNVPAWSYWYGFAASTHTDVTTPGFGNQYSAYAPGGGGVGGSASYGLFFDDSFEDPRLVLASASVVSGFYVTNTTYAHLSMRDGDAFAKKFGGATGTDPDWLLLTVQGYDAGGAALGSVDFYLADFRSSDSAGDYILGDWTWLDLSSLGAVKQLGFSLASSDSSGGFMNTPGYFALDDLQIVPEPGSAVLLAAGLLGLGLRRRVR